jgi:DNA repair exonuclease SbcCD nuclease subunit
MSYRAIFTADLHVSNTLPYAWRGDGVVTDRLRDTLAVLDQMADAADAARAADLWVIGDLVDRRLLDAVTLRELERKLAHLVDEREKNLYLIPGNHESSDSAASAYTLEGFSQLRPGRIHVWAELTTREQGGVVFHGLPYKPDREAGNVVRRVRDAQRTPGILLLHQSLVGGKVGSWVCPDGIPEEALQGFLGTLAGHFHTHQRVGAAQYLGASVQHHFGDTGEERGFWDITFSPRREPRAVLIPSKAPRFHVLSWDCAGDPPRLDSHRLGPGDYVQLDVVGRKAELDQGLKACREVATEMEGLGARLVKIRPLMLAERKTRSRASTERDGRITWPAAVAGYLDACQLEGLERARLQQIGQQAIEEAELCR